ncbi:hypothetical protein [Streptomyces apricus]|nr:hypothetical protein [Streptomyces apricus]
MDNAGSADATGAGKWRDRAVGVTVRLLAARRVALVPTTEPPSR